MSVDDQIAIKEIVKKSGSSFFWGMNVLNSKKKRAMFSIYAFCRIVDDIADELDNKKEKESKLKKWKKRIQHIYESVDLNNSIERELKFAIENFMLEKSDFYSIIDGMMMDARQDIKFPSKKILNLYLDRVAVAVGYLSIRVFGLSDNEKITLYFLAAGFPVN